MHLVCAFGNVREQAGKRRSSSFACMSVALFSESPFGLPFAVVGFWKFGFPETMSCPPCMWVGESI